MQQPEVTTELKTLQIEYRQPLAVLVFMKSLFFGVQITCVWLFSSLVHQLIVEQSQYSSAHFNWFAVAAMLWVLLRHLAQRHELALNRKIKLEFQDRIQTTLTDRQHSLAQQFSSFQWQQVMLQHIPSLADFITQYSAQKYMSVIVPLIALVWIFPVNWLITLILLVTLPLVPLFMVLVGHGAANLHRKYFIVLERLGGLFVDRLKALTLITSFNQHESQRNLLDTASRLVNQQTMKVVSVAFLSTTVLDFFATVSLALVAVFIGFTLLGELSFGPELVLEQGLFVLLVAPLLFSELKTLGRLYHQKAQAEGAWEQVDPIVSSPIVKKSTQAFSGIDWLNFKIDTPRLTARVLHLEKGERVHLQGVSGAGKSVLLQALMGLIPASHQLSGNVVYLGQSPTVLPGTVRDNLCLGTAYDDDKLDEVLAQVELTAVVSNLSDGIDTVLGEYPPLSGGELQRLMLARVLLRSADVILLDEPTAHLSASQHQQLSALVNKLTLGKTLIWASHKPLLDTWFDHTWQISDGVIITQNDTQSNKGANPHA